MNLQAEPAGNPAIIHNATSPLAESAVSSTIASNLRGSHCSHRLILLCGAPAMVRQLKPRAALSGNAPIRLVPVLQASPDVAGPSEFKKLKKEAKIQNNEDRERDKPEIVPD